MKNIIVKAITLSEDEVLVEDGGQSITLHDEYVHYITKGVWDVYDEALSVRKEVKYYNNRCIDRLSISNIEMFRLTANGKWVVDVEYFRIGFETYIEAKEFYNTVVEWRFQTQPSDK